MPPIVQKVRAGILSIPTLISLITSIGIILGTFITVDTRYAHSEEVSKMRSEQKETFSQMKLEQQQVVAQNRADLQVSTSVLRKQLLEDKIFDLELIPNQSRSAYDTARLEKYKRNLDDINRNISKNSNNSNSQLGNIGGQ